MYRIFSGHCGIHKLKNIKHIPRGIKFYFQRAWRGWADCDTWSMDYWFLEVMPQMLQYFRDTKAGYPISDINASFEENEKKWNEILDRMIFLCKEMNELDCSQQNEYVFDFTDDKFINRQEEIDAYQENCKKEFFELFSKYFYNLWS